MEPIDELEENSFPFGREEKPKPCEKCGWYHLSSLLTRSASCGILGL